MIEFLSGILHKKSPNYSIIDVNGVGYKVNCSINCYEILPELNTKVVFLIYFHIHDNNQELYGFLDEDERYLFKMLIGVSGIGPKTAINMLSTVPPDEFKSRLIAGEVKMLTDLPGIGPKTARRIIIELKDKFVKSNAEDLPIEDVDGNSDAYFALVSLGFKSSNVKNIIRKIEKDNIGIIKNIFETRLESTKKIDDRDERLRALIRLHKELDM